MSDRIELPSIRDRDLRPILQHFGLIESLEEGALHCAFCGGLITWDNLGAILIEQGKLVLLCDLSECLDTANKEHPT